MGRYARLARFMATALFIAGFAAPGVASPPVAAAAAACPTGTVTLADLIRLARDTAPLAARFPLPVMNINERAFACLGSRTLRVTAYVAGPYGVGGTSAYRLSPRWIGDGTLFLYSDSARVQGQVEGPSYMATSPPGLGDIQARYRGHWVVLTGRFGDPAADACRATGAKGETPSRSQAVAICQSIFVVSGISLLVAPATTTEGSPAAPLPVAAATTPCHAGSDVLLGELLSLAGDDAGPLVGRYDTDPMLMSDSALECYGRRTLRFKAYVRDPGVVGWEHPFGLKPAWFRSADGLFVSVAAELPPGVTPLVALAVPPALGDLQAQHVGHWVVVKGHFDDPGAATCTATGEPGVAPNAADAVAICRSTFVVASVSRTEAPATSMSDVPIAPMSWGGSWLAASAAFGGVAALWFTGRRRRR
jgi:hypothetical protein